MADNLKRERRLKIKRAHTEHAIRTRCDIGEDKARRLTEAGYDDLRKLRAATDEELRAVEGIGAAAVGKIRRAMR